MIILEPEPVPAGAIAEVTVLVSNSSGTGDADTELVGYTVEVGAGLLYHSLGEAQSGVVSDESRSIGGGTNRAVGFGALFWAAPDAPGPVTFTATYRDAELSRSVVVQ